MPRKNLKKAMRHSFGFIKGNNISIMFMRTYSKERQIHSIYTKYALVTFIYNCQEYF